MHEYVAAEKTFKTEAGSGGQQVTRVEHALGERVGVHTGVDPAEQAGRFSGETATGVQRKLDAARAPGRAGCRCVRRAVAASPPTRLGLRT